MLESKHMDKLESYLLQHIPERAGLMDDLEQYAKAHQVPIMDPASMNFLTQLVRMYKPKSILEIGTAIGYSALRMLEAQPDAQLVTIEKNEAMYELAKKNIDLHHQSFDITLKHGDAIDVIDELTSEDATFDFIFIDAAKAQYKKYFEAVQALTNNHAVIICDNILFKGYVVDETKVEKKRLQSLVKKIQQFNIWLTEQSDYQTSIVPIGDGMSISVKLV